MSVNPEDKVVSSIFCVMYEVRFIHDKALVSTTTLARQTLWSPSMKWHVFVRVNYSIIIIIVITHSFPQLLQLHGTDWKVLGENWSLLSLYQGDSRSSKTYRLIGCTGTNHDVILNCNLTSTCRYKKKTDDFHKFVDADGVVWGFGFYVKGDALKESNAFAKLILDTISGLSIASSSSAAAAASSPATGKPTRALPPIASSYSSSSSAGIAKTSTASYTPSSSPATSSRAAAPSSSFSFSSSLSSSSSSAANSRPVPQRPSVWNRPADTNGNKTNNTALSTTTNTTSSSSSSSSNVAEEPIALTRSSFIPIPSSSSTSTSSTPATPPRALASSFTPSSPPAPTTIPLPGSVSAVAGVVIDAHSHLAPPIPVRGKRLSLYEATVGTLGRLRQLPEKPLKQRTASVVTTMNVSPPFAIMHDRHVVFDTTSRKFTGLPSEWESLVNQSFGVSLQKVDSVKLDIYPARIPTLLFRLRERFAALKGFEAMGVFRVSPSSEEVDRCKKLANEGKVDDITDPYVTATLMKVFLRDLPERMLDSAHKGRVSMCEDEKDAWTIVLELPEPFHSLCVFILDLCVAVTREEQVNKMTATNLGICFGPNLFTPSPTDALAALVYSQKVARTMKLMIDYRAKNPPPTAAVTGSAAAATGRAASTSTSSSTAATSTSTSTPTSGAPLV